jgi:hypothetical protein
MDYIRATSMYAFYPASSSSQKMDIVVPFDMQVSLIKLHPHGAALWEREWVIMCSLSHTCSDDVVPHKNVSRRTPTRNMLLSPRGIASASPPSRQRGHTGLA